MQDDTPLDSTIPTAIRRAVEEAGQPESVADRLINWLNQLSLGQASLSSKEETERQFDSISGPLVIEEGKPSNDET
ncbi:CxC ATPase DNA modification system associated small protein [Gemmatimonadota bacterium]